MGFVANLIRFPAVQKIENRLRCDKVTESLKVGTVTGFYSKFHTLSSSAKILKIGCDLTKLGRV